MGDSRGHWEGNTLVVETINFNDQIGAGGGFFSDAAKVIERFTPSLRLGTPEEVVARRNLRAAELEIADAARATEAGDLLRAAPGVEEVEHYGNVLRVAVRGGADPAALVSRTLEGRAIAVAGLREVRITVEDAFVSMVRDQDRAVGAASTGGRAA